MFQLGLFSCVGPGGLCQGCYLFCYLCHPALPDRRSPQPRHLEQQREMSQIGIYARCAMPGLLLVLFYLCHPGLPDHTEPLNLTIENNHMECLRLVFSGVSGQVWYARRVTCTVSCVSPWVTCPQCRSTWPLRTTTRNVSGRFPLLCWARGVT